MNIQQVLPEIFNELSKPGRRRIGHLGEIAAARLFEKGGYEVSHARQRTKCGDLRVVNSDTGEVKRIEVKTARRSVDGSWRFTLASSGTGSTDYHHSDVLVLIAVHEKIGFLTPFVIPVVALGERKTINITSSPDIYAGVWAAYRQSAFRGLTL